MATEQELLDRIAKANAEREATEAEAEGKRRMALLIEQAEQAEREAKEAKAISVLEDEHGPVGSRLAVVNSPEGVVVLKRPTLAVWNRYQSQAESKKISGEANLQQLVRACAVYPTKAELDVLLDKVPGTLLGCSAAVVKLAGVCMEELTGK